ncbi:Flp pilus assembly protein CpaB [Noviherbaspirillum aridicola]|uniref:Flp pilus assembly protein CpaB n=1 Tax=Noviherbaspirillum aridicola TaxID=2849687 RepID=A0ABQ4Q573_9BURK|nr:Flp pilus assembly protein CpaB [Noviherbaspirillum aridicola]GIZ52347.1 Flp pilus assembly protein CpaB [Noviherbaspirillum aridicola]
MRISIPDTIRQNKTWAVLAAAIGIGLVAALIAYSYLSRQIAEIEARAKGKTVPVIVAKRDLNKGTPLTSETVAIRNVPVDYAHSVAVTPEQFGNLNGQALAYPMKAGEMVIWGLVEGRKTPTFSARVASGRRAMTVPVDEINSISGMLEPGDLIDLIVTIDRKSKKATLPLMQGVQVMATGQRSVDDPKSGEKRSYSTVTLDTTAEQAQNIIIAREAGKLTALLRNPNDKQPLTVNHAALAALLGSDVELLQGDGAREIPVLYGNASKLTPEALNLQAFRPPPSFKPPEAATTQPAQPAAPPDKDRATTSRAAAAEH